MRRVFSLSMMGLGVLVCGCQVIGDAVHNLAFETCLCTDNVVAKAYYEKMATATLSKWQATHRAPKNAQDFSHGFKDGFADYMESGGPGGAPPVPPQRYWMTAYQTPAGRQATEAWFAGFKEGAAAAKAMGARNLVVIPVKCDPPGPPGPPGPPVLGPGELLPGTPVSQPEGPPAPTELPSPRLAPQAPAGPPLGGVRPPAKQVSAAPGRPPAKLDLGEVIATSEPPASPARPDPPRPLPPPFRQRDGRAQAGEPLIQPAVRFSED
jgi:hypothetical protein